jgi:hypothetical protein
MGGRNHMANLITDSIEWAELSELLYINANQLINYLYDAFDEAQEIEKYVARQGDIGSARIPVTMNELELLNEKRRKLVSFANGIHYEIYDLVDNPFCLSLSKTIDKAYKLNPSDMKVVTDKFLLWEDKTSLADLLVSTLIDKKLKKDFEGKYKALDKDKPSKNLSEAMKEAKFWNNEFKKSEKCQKIAEEIFTQDVRDNWATYSEKKRKSIIEKYVDMIGQVFYGDRNWWDKLWGNHPSNIDSVEYTLTKDGSFGLATLNGSIEINYRFVTDPSKNYSIDKVIDTLTHETRHQYQQDVWKNPKKYSVPDSLRKEWDNSNYKSTKNPKVTYSDYYLQEVERDARAFAAVSRPSN